MRELPNQLLRSDRLAELQILFTDLRYLEAHVMAYTLPLTETVSGMSRIPLNVHSSFPIRVMPLPFQLGLCLFLPCLCSFRIMSHYS